jgi:hypothetical protein
MPKMPKIIMAPLPKIPPLGGYFGSGSRHPVCCQNYQAAFEAMPGGLPAEGDRFFPTAYRAKVPCARAFSSDQKSEHFLPK